MCKPPYFPRKGLSSIEPSDSSGEVDCSEEISGGLVVAGSDGAELLEPALEVFDEMTGLVDVFVVGARIVSVAPEWDDAGLACCL